MPPATNGGAANGGAFKERVAALERQLIKEALDRAGGNRTKAAEELGHLSAPALRQDQGIRPGRVSEPMTRTATFTATAEARPRGGIAIRLPVDPAEIWGERDRYYVTGTIERYPMRGVVASKDGEPYLELGPAWCRDPRVGPGASLHVNLSSGGTADLDAGERLRRGPHRRAEGPTLLRVAGDVLSERLGEVGRGREAPGRARPADRRNGCGPCGGAARTIGPPQRR